MYRLVYLFSFISFATFSQSVTISGIAPAYVGHEIEIYEIEDYLSEKQRFIASGKVAADSTFSIKFPSNKIQKVIVKGLNNRGFLYIQPNAKYNIVVPDRDQFDPYRPTGNMIELGFQSLDSTDINYKILGFQRWIDYFAGNNFHLRSYDQTLFGQRLDKFKENVEKAYAGDTSLFFRTYVRFSIAGLDNIQHGAERNRYEKHDFYIKKTPVQYENDAYMEYIANFYQELIPRLSEETGQLVYDGVLRSSPSLVMTALGTEYTLINRRIREMIMVNALSEAYHSGRFPQTNILTIIDSVENHSLFEANALIAKNLKHRLTELVPGGKAPDFVLTGEGKATKTLFDFSGKYIYLHFIDPNNAQSIKELDLLKNAHQKFGAYIQFVTIYQVKDSISPAGLKEVQELDWDVYGIESINSIWKNYRIEAFPHFVLIDATGNIVASPALGPTPNGQYETIDKTFFYIKTAIDEDNEPEENPYDPLNGDR